MMIQLPPMITEMIKSFCERHLASDDPYQFESYSNEQLIKAWYAHKALKIHTKALKLEVELRLRNPNTPIEYREAMWIMVGEK